MSRSLKINILIAFVGLILAVSIITLVCKISQKEIKDPTIILQEYEYGITCIDGMQYLYGQGHLIPYLTYDKITLQPKVRLCK